MGSKRVCSLLVAILFGLVMTGIAMAADTGPAIIILKARMGNVTFPHAAHQKKFKCGQCHHSKGPNGKQVPYKAGQKIEKCSACHNANSGMPKKLNSVKKVMHKNCRGCHKAMQKTNPKAPTKCRACHVKNK